MEGNTIPIQNIKVVQKEIRQTKKQYKTTNIN